MTENTRFLSVSQAAAALHLSVAEINDLLRRNLIESQVLVLRSSVEDYLAGVSA